MKKANAQYRTRNRRRKKEITDMKPEGIDVERKGPLAMVTLRRPHRLNAFNRAMFDQLEDAAWKLSSAPVPRAVIVTGAGPDAFCSGFDVNPDNPMVAEMADAIMRNGPRAVRSALTVIRAGRTLSLEATLDLEQRTAVDLIASGECLHGIGAFLTGGTPDFPDPPPEDTEG
jgi:enoyl-CoA hydratase/carnithine racemase